MAGGLEGGRVTGPGRRCRGRRRPGRCIWLLAFTGLAAGCGPSRAPTSDSLLAPVRVSASRLPAPPSPPVSLRAVEQAVSTIPHFSSFMLYQRGRLYRALFAHGAAADRPRNIKSASKSVLSALTGIALQQGYIHSLDEPISRYLPDYFEGLSENDPRRSITIRHLLTMSSGLATTSRRTYGAWVQSEDWVAYALAEPVEHIPGTVMTYSTGDSHLLSALLTAATGMSLRRFAQAYLFDPLQVRIGGWDRDPQGIYFGGNNMALSPEGLLRFGQLYLQNGRFDGRQILDPAWIRRSWRPYFPRSSYNPRRHDYGYLWWHNTFDGVDTWFAWGYGGQYVFVIPSLEAVVVITGDPDSRSRGGNRRIYATLDREVVPWLRYNDRHLRRSAASAAGGGRAVAGR